MTLSGVYISVWELTEKKKKKKKKLLVKFRLFSRPRHWIRKGLYEIWDPAPSSTQEKKVRRYFFATF